MKVGSVDRVLMSVLTVITLSATPALGQEYHAQADRSPDPERRRVGTFLASDSAVQQSTATDERFLLIEDRGDDGLQIVFEAASKVDLHVRGRQAGAVVIAGTFPPGVVARARIEFYVFRRRAEP